MKLQLGINNNTNRLNRNAVIVVGTENDLGPSYMYYYLGHHLDDDNTDMIICRMYHGTNIYPSSYIRKLLSPNSDSKHSFSKNRVLNIEFLLKCIYFAKRKGYDKISLVGWSEAGADIVGAAYIVNNLCMLTRNTRISGLYLISPQTAGLHLLRHMNIHANFMHSLTDENLSYKLLKKLLDSINNENFSLHTLTGGECHNYVGADVDKIAKIISNTIIQIFDK